MKKLVPGKSYKYTFFGIQVPEEVYNRIVKKPESDTAYIVYEDERRVVVDVVDSNGKHHVKAVPSWWIYPMRPQAKAKILASIVPAR